MDDHCQQFFPPVFGIFTDNRTLQDQIETHETNFYQEADRKFFYQYQEEDFGPPSQMLRRVKIIFGGAGDSADHSAARFPDTESRGQGVGKSQFANFVRLASYRWA